MFVFGGSLSRWRGVGSSQQRRWPCTQHTEPVVLVVSELLTFHPLAHNMHINIYFFPSCIEWLAREAARRVSCGCQNIHHFLTEKVASGE